MHGWKYSDFHSRCDNMEFTISLFKIKDGDCIGGYTKERWSSDSKFKGDNESMLFNLSCCRHFPSKKTGADIGCYNNRGPHFGRGELCAMI